MVTSCIWDCWGLRYHLHEAVSGSLIRLVSPVLPPVLPPGVHCRRGDNEHHHGLLIVVGAWRSVSFMYHGGTGCNYVMRCDLYGGLAAPLLRCGGEVRGMKPLCSGSVLKCGVW